MGSLWRSQEMRLAQLIVQSDAVYETVSALGELGLVQFRDLNPDVNAFQRKYVNEVRRCDEMERKLRFFEAEVEKAGMQVSGAAAAATSAAPDVKEMQSMEAEFEQLEREMREINGNEQTLRKQELELTELSAILSKTAVFFDEAEAAGGTVRTADGSASSAATPLLSAEEDRSGQLGFVTGVIAREKLPGFERLLWRACRGNVFLREVDISEAVVDPVSGEEVHKKVFIVFFQGGELGARVRKICEGYDATIYPCPDTAAQRRELDIKVKTRIEDLQSVLHRTAEHRRQVLARSAFKLGAWLVKVTKIKSIYHTMNKFDIDVARNCLVAECWYPAASQGEIKEALRRGAERSATDVPTVLSDIPTHEQPPTYFATNKFTSGFQSIVDAYGIASYREVNPTPFTIITFPFLFAVMFGDFGHGTIMALIAFFLIYKEKKLASFDGGEIWDTMYGGRYIIFLMGLFSIYTGFIYNDIFSKSITLGGSGWKVPDAQAQAYFNDHSIEIDLLAPDATSDNDFRYPYVFGIDPIWQVTENKLTFTNSYKMKLSVILGIGQMLFGVILSLANHRFFRKPLRVFHEFIPQVLFLTCIFGYLVIMIFYKWTTPIQDFPNKNPPSLLLMLINMFLQFGAPPDDGEVLYGAADGSTQQYTQMILVVVAVVCVPWMLFVRPCILRARMKRAAERGIGAHEMPHDDENVKDAEINGPVAHGDEDHSFGAIMVHQAIHTIEFCLGCISNTASYLRLWALSLAHAQLSDVLWEMVLQTGFSSWWMLYLTFAAWAALTIAVLLIMEGLSAFLHALRLHWVEFQNKFYEGTGIKFAPFSFRRILAGEEDEA
ncbi:uncharacterized protein MONBRDRAFT_18895 [Monosiga brevicollis MX1]|uniref:V-type proton ATPase subunit a n=1 Tax=Monosiga brevicollis TaxID=81824 RepID=A9UY82_MONBE|nr:uncharacterized protein MONBRDRAFT_18895 [Monosiga brevicollis MX1]EDQ89979.1 predicted protein [Monosiga brevicollis MX1]|eukprot:XP_001745401.1 hypothetical protein [Monosiga brevicollis MX1]